MTFHFLCEYVCQLGAGNERSYVVNLSCFPFFLLSFFSPFFYTLLMCDYQPGPAPGMLTLLSLVISKAGKESSVFVICTADTYLN